VLPFLLPWPRLALLIRRILATRWDETTWPPCEGWIATCARVAPAAGAGGVVEL